jgi:hypothetical protein
MEELIVSITQVQPLVFGFLLQKVLLSQRYRDEFMKAFLLLQITDRRTMRSNENFLSHSKSLPS